MNARTSNTTEAAVNPMKCIAVGLSMKFIIVAMTPTRVAVPSFLTHQTARVMDAKPIRSQRNGR